MKEFSTFGSTMLSTTLNPASDNNNERFDFYAVNTAGHEVREDDLLDGQHRRNLQQAAQHAGWERWTPLYAYRKLL